ncbi:hypothetical protein N0V90_010715 [Kalmusia sp. IMI 367209]|nr:hypothetical protein N0V90_010715 [Kalmusia sp. IMI 367209]
MLSDALQEHIYNLLLPHRFSHGNPRYNNDPAMLIHDALANTANKVSFMIKCNSKYDGNPSSISIISQTVNHAPCFAIVLHAAGTTEIIILLRGSPYSMGLGGLISAVDHVLAKKFGEWMKKLEGVASESDSHDIWLSPFEVAFKTKL